MDANQLENQTIILKNGLKMGYAEFGDPTGYPLFFFHGWPGSRLHAKSLHNVAVAQKIRIISPDRPGYGLSDFCRTRKLLDWVDDVLEIADKLNISIFSVLGVSGGGPYAAACAYKVPSERMNKVGIVVGLSPTNVEGVLAGMAFWNKLLWRSYHRFPFLMKLSSISAFLQVRRYIPDFFSIAFRAKKDQEMLLSEEVKNNLAIGLREAFRQGKDGCAKDLELYTGHWGFQPKDIRARVFLWYGDCDKNVSPNMGKYYHSQIKDSVLTIYPNEGHMILRTHPDEILAALI